MTTSRCFVRIALLGSSLMIASCTSNDNDLPASATSTASTTQAYETQPIDLISPNVCVVRGAVAGACVLPARTITAPSMETAIPLRTVVRSQASGNCATQYTLEVKVSEGSASGTSDPVVLRYLSSESRTLRRRDGLPIASLSVADASAWTKYATFDAGCRVHLTASMNEPDVDSRDQAAAILASIQTELNSKTAERDRYGHLTQYHRAYQFVRTVAESFRTELTLQGVQDLRTNAEQAIESLAKLAGTCDGFLDDNDRQNLFTLMFSLPQLGKPEDYLGPNGKPKTLEEFVGPKGAEILETVQKLAKENDSPNGSTYEAAYQQAAREVELLRAKLALAKAQLSRWTS